ncbi:MAG: glutamate--tRNA ligase family protein, partial [Nitrospira sp.]
MNEKNEKIITRFAPSPTGLLHMGNYRTAVFAFLYARKNNGQFILRIEDTDRQRSKKEYEDNILESLEWLGLKYDAFYRQSENIKDHTETLEKLIREDKAYISKEEAKDGSGTIKEIVRFRNPKKVVVFDDLVRGKIETDTTDLGDFVIAKSLTEPLFHLAVIVDDHNEGVTHVIRGEDHIPNTPRQILIHEALGIDVPKYAHLPLVLAEDRTKLSKRKGALPVTDYKDRGYLPQTLLNFMALIGWNPGGEQEVFSLDELIKLFDITKIQKGGGIFNPEKLDWLNKEHMKTLSLDIRNKEI